MINIYPAFGRISKIENAPFFSPFLQSKKLLYIVDIEERGFFMTKNRGTQMLVLTALFAAIIYIGTQVFQFPLGPAFVHFGNIFLMLAAISLGPIYGTAAGVIGFTLFDLLNGYAYDIPKIIILTIVKGVVCGVLYRIFYRKIGEEKSLILSVFLAFLTYPILDTIWRTVALTLGGSAMQPAFVSALSSQLSPIVNMVIGVILVPIFYKLIFKPVFNAAHIPLYQQTKKSPQKS